jgi:hypothetical protein
MPESSANKKICSWETKLINDKSAARQLAALPHTDLDAVDLEQIGVIPRAWRDSGR